MRQRYNKKTTRATPGTGKQKDFLEIVDVKLATVE
jgi:hypothetical protein